MPSQRQKQNQTFLYTEKNWARRARNRAALEAKREGERGRPKRLGVLISEGYPVVGNTYAVSPSFEAFYSRQEGFEKPAIHILARGASSIVLEAIVYPGREGVKVTYADDPSYAREPSIDNIRCEADESYERDRAHLQEIRELVQKCRKAEKKAA